MEKNVDFPFLKIGDHALDSIKPVLLTVAKVENDTNRVDEEKATYAIQEMIGSPWLST